VRKPILIALFLVCLAVPAVALAASGGASSTTGAASAKLVSADVAKNPLHAAIAKHRKHVRAIARQKRIAARKAATAVSPLLQKIAACESGGNPSAIGGGGLYRGKYQFNTGTWASVGGTGDPAAAPEAEQDKRAAILLARSGPSQWPVCSQ
jgi:hypothetical protein